MKKIRFLVIALCCWAYAPGAYAQVEVLRIIVYGDSLTSGYQLQAGESFADKLEVKLREVGYQNIEVKNMSIAGETTTGGVDRINSVLALRPDIVVVELGGNDALRGISSALIHRNLATIISRLQSERVYVILVGIKPPAHLGYSYAQQIEAAYRGLADFYGVPFYPHALEGVTEHPEYTLADGLHPNARGVDIMVEGMYRMVDTGLRWKWEEQQQQLYYKQHQPVTQQIPNPKW